MRLEQRLDAALADRLAGAVARELPLLELLLADLADRPDHVRGERAVRVLAPRIHFGEDARQRVAVRLDARELLEGEIVGEPHRLEARAAARRDDALARLLAGVADQHAEQVEGALAIAQLARHHLELEGRTRRGQHAALAIHQLAARRGDALGPDRVALRALAVLLALDDLELEEPHQEEREEGAHHDAEQAQALLEEIVDPGAHAAERSHRNGAPASKRSPPRGASGVSDGPTAIARTRAAKGTASALARTCSTRTGSVRGSASGGPTSSAVSNATCRERERRGEGHQRDRPAERELALADAGRHPGEQVAERERAERTAREEVGLPADRPRRHESSRAGQVEAESDRREQRRIRQRAARQPRGQGAREPERERGECERRGDRSHDPGAPGGFASARAGMSPSPS